MSARVRFNFSECTALVTGGSNGIGLAVASAFADAGAAVTITGTKDHAADYEHDLSRFTYRALQLTDAAAIDAVAASFPVLDVLINNAGAALPGGRDEWQPEVFEESLQINLVGAFRLASACRAQLAAARLAGGGAIVNLASMSSYFGIATVPGYGAAKAGVVQMTKTLAATWAADGIRVNAVAPGHISTNMTAPMESIESLMAPIIARTPMHRWGTADEVSGAVLFLASPAAAFITGQTISVSGGLTMHG